MTETEIPQEKNNFYFTQEHEDAICQYVKTDDMELRNKLYVEVIGPILELLINKIVYTYKFNQLPNIENLIEDCKTWIVTIIDKYDPDKKSRAFSYFSVVTKNWFMQKIKKRSKNLLKEVSLEEIEFKNHENLTIGHEYEENRIQEEFNSAIRCEINSWSSAKNLTSHDEKVIEAIKIILSSSEDIEIFNKKAIYIYLRDLTGLNTKQISRSLKKINKRYYSPFKKKWDDGDV